MKIYQLSFLAQPRSPDRISLANAIDDKAFYVCRKSFTTNAFAEYISACCER